LFLIDETDRDSNLPVIADSIGQVTWRLQKTAAVPR
jgi:hypothetical protein